MIRLERNWLQRSISPCCLHTMYLISFISLPLNVKCLCWRYSLLFVSPKPVAAGQGSRGEECFHGASPPGAAFCSSSDRCSNTFIPDLRLGFPLTWWAQGPAEPLSHDRAHGHSAVGMALHEGGFDGGTEEPPARGQQPAQRQPAC